MNTAGNDDVMGCSQTSHPIIENETWGWDDGSLTGCRFEYIKFSHDGSCTQTLGYSHGRNFSSERSGRYNYDKENGIVCFHYGKSTRSNEMPLISDLPDLVKVSMLTDNVVIVEWNTVPKKVSAHMQNRLKQRKQPADNTHEPSNIA